MTEEQLENGKKIQDKIAKKQKELSQVTAWLSDGYKEREGEFTVWKDSVEIPRDMMKTFAGLLHSRLVLDLESLNQQFKAL